MKTLTCPHSPKRTCNGGLNSCVMCPKSGHKENAFWLFVISTILALIVLFLCSRCNSESEIHGTSIKTHAIGNDLIREFKIDGCSYLMRRSSGPPIHKANCDNHGYYRISIPDSVMFPKRDTVLVPAGFSLYDSIPMNL